MTRTHREKAQVVGDGSRGASARLGISLYSNGPVGANAGEQGAGGAAAL